MLDDFQDMVNKGLVDVKHVGLTDLQRAVDKALKLWGYTILQSSTRLYHPEPKYWVEKILSEEN